MNFVTKMVVAVVSCLTPLAAFAFGNGDVLEMLSAGLGEELIVQKIQTAPAASFDTSVSALIALKKAGATDTIMKSMVSKSASPQAPVQAAQDGSCKLEGDIEGIQPVRVNGAIVGLTYKAPKLEGVTTLLSLFSGGNLSQRKAKLVIAGDRPSQKIPAVEAEFLDILHPAGSSSDDLPFALVKMTAEEGTRIIPGEVVQQGKGAGFYADKEARVALVPVKVGLCSRDGKKWEHYRLKSAPLAPGLYGFVSVRGIYDFSVD